MDEIKLINLNKMFDNIDDDIFFERQLDEDIDKYNSLTKQIQDLKNKINNKIEGTNYIFDESTGLLIEKQNVVIGVKKCIIYNNGNSFNILNNCVIVNNDEFKQIYKLLKNDKESAASFINLSYKNFNCLKDIKDYIKKFCCGICSENNILSINKEISANDKLNIVYRLVFNQINNGFQDLYGEIFFFTTTKDYYEKIKVNDNIEIRTFF